VGRPKKLVEGESWLLGESSRIIELDALSWNRRRQNGRNQVSLEIPHKDVARCLWANR
jgi:hypothetical protein